MYVETNFNPCKKSTGDCVVRAIAKILGITWRDTYIKLTAQGLEDCDIISSNEVWGNFLKNNGFKRYIIPDTCPRCYTVKDFCEDHPHGKYILATGNHVVAVIDGDYYDAWDSGNEIPIFYFQR